MVVAMEVVAVVGMVVEEAEVEADRATIVTDLDTLLESALMEVEMVAAAVADLEEEEVAAATAAAGELATIATKKGTWPETAHSPTEEIAKYMWKFNKQ